MFKVMAFCHVHGQPCAPLINSFIHDTLHNTGPSLNKLLLQVISIMNGHPVHTLLHPTPDMIINLIQLQTVGWPQLR